MEESINIAMKKIVRKSDRVNLSMLAETLDLSKGTVSKALNGYGDVSERTKNRVLRTAKKLGYKPLAHAQAIRTGRIKSIGLVLQVDDYDGYNFFLRDFLIGISQTTSSLGWTLTVASASSYEDFEEVVDRLIDQRKVDGFILPRTQNSDPRYVYLSQLSVPTVLFGRLQFQNVDQDTNSSWYDIDGQSAFADAVIRMKNHGHSRIGFVGAPSNYTYAQFRKSGYELGLAESAIEVDEALIISDMQTREDGERATEKLLGLPNPPTAIIFSTDEIAMGAYVVAEKFGLKLGHDLSISAYDGTARGGYMMPSLTSYKVNLHEAGARLSALLIERVKGEKAETLREVANAEFMKGGSDGPPKLNSHQLAEKISRTIENFGNHQI